ncbi:carboxy terminal-processing peptidase [Spiribacter salinus]|uniref:carboxy terminal-processing peptidase n=1 Tax=Spiribacter salinus TaxID=1335746 RepID=UPI0028F3E4B1|nr:carboxy terminal-processing peptidase [Spiribacter salinus]
MSRYSLCHHIALALALAIGISSTAAADRLTPSEIHPRASQVIGELLSRYHYRDESIDDALSEAVYDAYFEALDPDRYYFLEADIQAFRHRADQLDDELRAGELDTAFDIFARYRERVEDRSEHALDRLEKGLAFDTEARLDLDRSDADWAASRSELDQIWDKRVINDALIQRLNSRDRTEVRESLTKRYERLVRSLEQSSAEDVFQSYMSTWASQFDPHSSYMSPRTSENFDINMSLSLEGIGAMLTSEGDFVEIVELIPGGPAAGSGDLSPGDQITGVGDDPDAIQDVVGWRLGDVVDLIRGPKGSEVHLRVMPEGRDGHETTITLTRNTVELEEQAAQAEVREVKRDGQNHRIGVIDIPAFYADLGAANAGAEDYRNTSDDVARLLDSETLSDIDGLVIDLRGNAGGSLEEAVQMTGLFIDQGPVVQVNRSNGQREVLEDQAAEPAEYDGPLGVMVDSNSASASEIFAAALQDYGRGVVIGDQTFGKGTVQTLIGLDQFGVGSGVEDAATGRLKLTIAKFYRINGESTQLEGVQPDLHLPYPQSSDESGERSAERALPWDTIRSTEYRQQGELARYLSELRRRHDRRMLTDPALMSVSAEAKRLREAEARTEVSLNEDRRRAAQEQQEAARLEAVNAQLAAYGRETIEDLDDLDRDQLPDTLLDETAEVMVDLAELIGEDGTVAQAAAR